MIIYKITNLINNKAYVGQTMRALEVRVREHLNMYCKSDSVKMKRAVKKYGPTNFIASVLFESDEQLKIDEMEIFYIYYFNSVNNGYNICWGGKYNTVVSQETRDKMSKTRLGKKLPPKSDEMKKRTSEYMKNKIANFSEEERLHYFHKLNSNRTYKLSDEHKSAIVKAHSKNYSVKNPQGKLIYFTNLVEFSKLNNLSYECMAGIIKGTQNRHRGYSELKIIPKEEF